MQIQNVCPAKAVYRKKISPVLMTEEFSEVLKIITLLLMVHVSLREGWFNCGGQECLYRITLHYFHKNLYTWECIEVCVLLEHVLISYTGGVCYLWVLEASFCEVAVQLVKACVG